MDEDPAAADGALDARGLRCPLPVLRMEARLRAMAPGARLKVLADDPVAAVDIPLFARQGGHLAERLPDEGGTCAFLITKAGR